MTAGIYFGARAQAIKNEQTVSDLNDQLVAQKLNYEQRLGTQSAAYALDARSFSGAVVQFAKALDKMDAKNDRRAAERERAQAAAIAAAQKAAVTAAATAQKTDQIAVKQDAMQQQVTEAASAAKATEKKLDTATLPAAAVPAHPWGK
ncbi:hypothetical protein [Caballeronia sordidicola]|nr:hypothetical protein [Caballeronia sordidicola]